MKRKTHDALTLIATTNDHPESVTVAYDATPLEVEVTYRVGERRFRVEETVRNLSKTSSCRMQVAFHPFWKRGLARPEELPLFVLPGMARYYPVISAARALPIDWDEPAPSALDCSLEAKPISPGDTPGQAAWNHSYVVPTFQRSVTHIVWKECGVMLTMTDENATSTTIHAWSGTADRNVCALEHSIGLVGRAARVAEFFGHGLSVLGPGRELERPHCVDYHFELC